MVAITSLLAWILDVYLTLEYRQEEDGDDGGVAIYFFTALMADQESSQLRGKT